VFEEIKQIVYRIVAQFSPFAWATIVSYDDGDHTCTVALEPDGDTFPHLPILLPFRGMRMPHDAGLQGAVLLIAGIPQVLLGVTYTTHTPIPATGMVIEEAVQVVGDLTVAGGLYLAVAPELPPASSLYTYALLTVGARATGLPNARPARTYQCLPSADGSLHWVPIAVAP